jgi:hypothetical protein
MDFILIPYFKTNLGNIFRQIKSKKYLYYFSCDMGDYDFLMSNNILDMLSLFDKNMDFLDSQREKYIKFLYIMIT